MSKTIDVEQRNYSSILLKLSGEALLGDKESGLDLAALQQVAANIAEILAIGAKVALVIGGGNFIRGAVTAKCGLDRAAADQIGMLATMMNGLALRAIFEETGLPVTLMSALPIAGIVDAYNHHHAKQDLLSGKVVILTGGTGCPLFSTDSAASLRGIELGVDLIIKATKVDGIYSADPKQYKEAKRYSHLSYQQILQQNLEVMDATAICLCRDHHMPIRVCDMNKPHVLKNIVLGADEGTLITES